MSRRSAPRRAVIDKWQTGGYATTLWHHRLDCGHVEVRKRQAGTSEIACMRCEAAAAIDVHSPALAAPVSAEASLTADVAILRAQIASSLKVPLDSVTVQVSIDKIAGAMIFLEPRQIAQILGA